MEPFERRTATWNDGSERALLGYHGAAVFGKHMGRFILEMGYLDGPFRSPFGWAVYP